MPDFFPRAPDEVSGITGWAAETTRVWEAFVEEFLKANRTIGGRLITLGARQSKVTEVTAATYVIKRTDHIIDVNFAGAVSLTCPEQPFRGQEWLVQDSSGAASSNNISLSPSTGLNLNGGSSPVVLATNYGRLLIVYNGTQFIAS